MRRERRYFDPNIPRKGKILADHLVKNEPVDGIPVFSLIEFNLSGLCNRKCVFCPRVDPKVFPNVNEHIPLELYEKVIIELAKVRFSGTILYSGFGEPLLYKKIESVIELTRAYCPEVRIEINSDGDFVNPARLRKLFGAGLTSLLISMYDGPDQMEKFEAMKNEIGLTDDQLILRVRWLPPEQHYGITLSNRAGMVEIKEAGMIRLKEPLKRPCYYPFYQVLIDYDGAVLLCPHDWGKKLIVGNLNHQSLMDLWIGHVMKRVRMGLAASNRHFAPCAVCNVDGTLIGQSHFDRWMRYYRDGQSHAG